MRLTTLLAVGAAALVAGCATPQNNYDPLEKVNRGVFAFNTVLDRAAVKPVATAYKNHMPGPAKDGTHNFFENFDDFYSIFSNLLQGKVSDAGNSAGRVLVNTSIGMFGMVDWASDMGLKKTEEDFGQVLGSWGVGTGPYLMLPFFGPSSARDMATPLGRFFLDPVDAAFDPTTAVEVLRWGGEAVDARAGTLALDPLIEAQIDPYAYLRDAWLQKRYNDVWDGSPPAPLPLGDDGDEDDAATDAAAAAPAAPASASAPAAAEPAK
ncbi:VacJ family lipoprotein [Andreprevotia sp. IGB-42]|uniref:MlaA family lipoprotein n=1 Tax=Andreprevotia sp. IGB-42 TaxID=2497473 RepID=UPI001357B35A|nr:VacJ family lipoprotein [Andreprevotia sp. IGB-42]